MKKYRDVFLKNEKEIGILRDANKIVATILDELGRNIKPGLSTFYFEELVQKMCKEFKVKPAFQGYHDYPFALCCSVNEAVVHGFPSKEKVLEEGDIVSFDVGVTYKGFHGDAARTFGVGSISKEASRLIQVTSESLELGVQAACVGNHVYDISAAIQQHIECSDFSIVKCFVGHGIGTGLHEKPEIPNFVPYNGPGLPLKVGMVLAIEPMVTIGSSDVKILEDKWTAVTCDNSLAAHFEHSVAVLSTGPYILDQL